MPFLSALPVRIVAACVAGRRQPGRSATVPDCCRVVVPGGFTGGFPPVRMASGWCASQRVGTTRRCGHRRFNIPARAHGRCLGSATFEMPASAATEACRNPATYLFEVRHAEGMRLLPRLAIDVLPDRLWTPGNLHALPGGEWHFCFAPCDGGRSARTIEWRSHEVASGRLRLDLASAH